MAIDDDEAFRAQVRETCFHYLVDFGEDAYGYVAAALANGALSQAERDVLEDVECLLRPRANGLSRALRRSNG